MTGLLCYVLGCGEGGARGAVRSVHHAAFGRVTACASHDPNRYDAGRPLVIDVPRGAEPRAQDDGHAVAVVRPVPRVPPAGVANVPALPAGVRPF